MVEIVKMAACHTEVLAQLEKRCFPTPWSREALLEELENPNAYFCVALLEGRVAGYAGMQCACGECYIANVAVFPECRRRGAATALLSALGQEARRQGGEFLSLEVRASNCKAIKLYTKLGFEKVGHRKDFYSDPREDGLIMTKRF